MATETPKMNLYQPLIQALYQAFERSAFADGGIEDVDDEIGQLYNQEFKRPYVCELVADVLSGRWSLGTTQEEVSERLGLTADRSWVSRAIHQGRMSFEVYLRLRCCPTRPDDWEPDVKRLRPAMERSAFIGVARKLASRITDRPTLVPQRLNELNYELICEMFARMSSWLPEHVAGNASAAARIVRAICEDPRRSVLPSWYADRERRSVQNEIQRLSTNEQTAFAHLTQLQRDWLDVFVGTFAALELIKWRHE